MFKKQFSDSASEEHDDTKSTDSEDIIACHYCAIHAPKSSGLIRNGAFYCCEEHAVLDEKENDS